MWHVYERYLAEVQDFNKVTTHFREFREYPSLIEKKQKMSTYNQLDLETLGSQLVIDAQKYLQTL
jgi:hypothetical protein